MPSQRGPEPAFAAPRPPNARHQVPDRWRQAECRDGWPAPARSADGGGQTGNGERAGGLQHEQGRVRRATQRLRHCDGTHGARYTDQAVPRGPARARLSGAPRSVASRTSAGEKQRPHPAAARRQGDDRRSTADTRQVLQHEVGADLRLVRCRPVAQAAGGHAQHRRRSAQRAGAQGSFAARRTLGAGRCDHVIPFDEACAWGTPPTAPSIVGTM
jgi:hypothetical protein